MRSRFQTPEIRFRNPLGLEHICIVTRLKTTLIFGEVIYCTATASEVYSNEPSVYASVAAANLKYNLS